MRPGPKPIAAEIRLWRFLTRGESDECWVFSGGKDDHGYGRMHVDGRPEHAHRVAYRYFVGPIPDGLHVLHHCDNPPCCNPRHLYVGTPKQNAADKVRRGRARGPNVRGEAHWSTRLTDVDVATIRAVYAGGGVTQKALGQAYGVTQAQIHNIVRGKQRAEVIGAPQGRAARGDSVRI